MAPLTSGPSDGWPILFLHGGFLNRMMWKPVIAHLDHRYLCVAIDLPGHGSRMGDSFTMAGSIAATLDAILTRCRGRATVVGLSLGGYVAQASAAVAPDAVAGLLLAGATVRYTGWSRLTTSLYGYVFPLAGRAAIKAFPAQLAKTVGDELTREIVQAGLSARAGGEVLRRLPGRDYAAALSGFPRPVMIANGERDKANIEGVSGFLTYVPGAQVITIDDAGHACPLQQPLAFAQAVDHLMSKVMIET